MLSTASEGDEADIEYDDEKEKYIVSVIDNIGYLSKTDADFFEDNIESGDYEASIYELSENDEGKYTAKIEIRY